MWVSWKNPLNFVIILRGDGFPTRHFCVCLRMPKTGKNVLIFFDWQAAQCFNVNEQVRLSGTSPEMIRSILTRLAVMGTDYIQLNKFATHQRGQTAGLVLQAFLGALQNYLQCYRATVLSVNGKFECLL